MTLVAHFEHEDINFLVGDMLITADRRPSGMAKKIYIITDHLAVGWTGHKALADYLIPALRDYFSKANASFEELEKFLGEQRDFGSLRINLNGWVVGAEEVDGFIWDSDSPGFLVRSDFFSGGSGGAIFTEEMINSPVANPGGEARSDHDTISDVLVLMAKLMLDESGSKNHQNLHAFGVFYEVACFIGGKFQYVNNIVYVPIFLTYKDWCISKIRIHTCYLSEVFNGSSLIRIIDNNNPSLGIAYKVLDSSVRGGASDENIIAERKKVATRCDWIVASLIFHDEGNKSTHLSLGYMLDSPLSSFKFREIGHGFDLEFNAGIADLAYKAIRLDGGLVGNGCNSPPKPLALAVRKSLAKIASQNGSGRFRVEGGQRILSPPHQSNRSAP